MNGPRILIAGVGNIFLGDDAFGVEVARVLARRTQPDEVRVVDFGIRGLDLTYALLDGYDVVILVDAAPRGGPPGSLYLLEVEPPASGAAEEMGLAVEGHNLDPARVFRLAAALGSSVRRLLVVGCEPSPPDEVAPPESVWQSQQAELARLSEPVRGAVGEAVHLVESLVERLLATNGDAVLSPAEVPHV